MNPKSKASQGGSVLIEAMMAVVIFSFGLLGIIGLQASMASQSSEAKYRAEAGFYVNRLLGEMGTADRLTPTAMNTFASTPSVGASYTNWYNDIKNTNIASGLLGLPGAATYPPEVIITPVYNPTNIIYPVSYDVRVTVFWKAPGRPVTEAPHKHVVVASVSAD